MNFLDTVSSTDVTSAEKPSKKRDRPVSSPLHSVGYRVYKSAFMITNVILRDAVRLSRSAVEIFNYNESKKNDYKRLEASFNMRQCEEETRQFILSLDHFVAEEISSTLMPSEWHVISSKAGCQDQAPHCDFEPDLPLATVPDEEMPLSVLVALMPGTRLNIWPNSIRLACLSGRILRKMDKIACEVLNLDAGDLIVFRGDFIHAGSCYSEDNYRLHRYLDSESVPREPNTTWTVHEDGEPPLKKLILSKDTPK